MTEKITAREALELLREGNKRYAASLAPTGDISSEARLRTAEEGQSPYAVVIACSDSRVIPEAIFDCGIGDIFAVRVAGNVVDRHQLGSAEYAVSHLGCRLIVVLGHTCCGAVGAALSGGAHGYISSITDVIKENIGGETEERAAALANAKAEAEKIRSRLELPDGTEVVCALYDIKTGLTEFYGG